ncbi:flp pilus-assembly TadE/G-like family protein [Micromonospora cathayae]|uniref:Flp pilus-assembly TadE/G-like family protein n=1 Tax=Micromonospora cathayae TaxID=3028804 RepID=A0ABY7ZTL8_9ACTN|nr:Rv3654c family TadE-like protein [Micromonospora sp. HUAS 3]WDZ86392.1 flp pilus-assembly TadE/G-like family protein [Micromonospora sp. HUAS 3]
MGRAGVGAVLVPDGRDQGGASVLLLAVGLVLLLTGVFGAVVGAARTARQQARMAADFAALAGAALGVRGEEAACRRAADFANANRARLTRCQLEGLDLLVTTEVTVELAPGLTRRASITSRAGPTRG